MQDNENWDELKRWAVQSFEDKEYEHAATLFDRLADAAPDSDERGAILIYQGRCLEILGRFAEARECFRDARKLGDGSREYLARLNYLEAGLDAREGHDEVALTKLNTLLNDLRDVIQTSEYRDLYEGVQIVRAGLLQNLQRPDEALPIFLESRSFGVEKPRDYAYRMAYCMAQCGQAEKAVDIVINALRADLDISAQCTARYYLGAIYTAKGEYRKALTELHFCEQHLEESNLAVAPLMESIAYAYKKLGISQKATQYMQVASTRTK